MIKTVKILFVILLFSISSIEAQTTDVWDFGATSLDAKVYQNLLSESVINSMYASTIVAGSSGNNFPVSFTVGDLSWVGNAGDRLRTTNTNLSRYDANLASVSIYSGRLYCNGTPNLASGVPTNRFLRINLMADDQVTIICRTDAAASLLFINENNPALQSDNMAISSASGSTTEAKFVAKNTGSYKIYSADGKASYYRIIRKSAVFTAVSGNLDLSHASGIPSNYAVVFTNAAGKTWTSAKNLEGSYTANLPVGFSYGISIANANGYVVSNGSSLDLTSVSTSTLSHNISIMQVNLYELSGSIKGLASSISSLGLAFIANPSFNTVYIPSVVINNVSATYSVQLEAAVPYTIQANGVNDYQLSANAVLLPASNSTSDIVFTLKPVYPVSITTNGLSPIQQSSLQLKFTNLNESGSVYTFNAGAGISLRDGVYSISYSGLENYPIDLGLISNLKVNGAGSSKTLNFKPVTVWSFDDQAITTTSAAGYKGMLLSGTVATRIANGDLSAKTGAIIKIPIKVGETVSITYYYAANFAIEGGAAITSSSGSTTQLENIVYTSSGLETSPGYVTISMGGTALTSYFTQIQIGGSTAYKPIIRVGVGKDFETINAAVGSVSNMVRSASDRVTILIDPGNYEEMIDITQANISLKNAALHPSINLLNKGVTIAEDAVRISSYYGVGYNYYSMKNNQKWDADVLRVNKENGYQPYSNVSGTTNNSYWNATIVVSANGFIAEDIIIENSYNQYISFKESQDIVELAVGNKGVRPNTYGSTAVQDKSFVERAAAIAIKNNIQKVILNKCRVVGRQDTFFGGTGARVAVYKGEMMGAVDYIFGGMDVVFYHSKLIMNISDASNDACYIAAAQQSSGRGFLLYECTIDSAEPGVETASAYGAKPGYFGRPWLANTSEVVFYKTTIKTASAIGSVGQSLIQPLGWLDSLGGRSTGMYEYGTMEQSGINNTAKRASWTTLLAAPKLNDGSPISTLNFTQGNDGWDPFPALIANDVLAINHFSGNSSVAVSASNNNVVLTQVKSNTEVKVYSVEGRLIKVFETNCDTHFNLDAGIWIVNIKDNEGMKSIKVITY